MSIYLMALFAASFLTSVLGVWAIRRLACHRKILDVPNGRSSHSRPTPIGLVVIGVSVGWYFIDPTDHHRVMALTLGVGGGFITFVGWLDDCWQTRAATRFVLHCITAAWAVYQLSPGLTFSEKAFAFLGVAWAISYYNFMDGLDGLAASEAVTVCFFGGIIAFHNGFFDHGVLTLVVAAASLGFLVFNRPPASIFMGDCGSGFLGYFFGCLAIDNGFHSSGGFITWAILLFAFWGDASFTLLHRIIKREPFWLPHRTHLYQRANKAGYSHGQIDLAFFVINVIPGLIALRFGGVI